MKTLLLSCLVLLSAISTVRAQDPGMMAAQAAQQANDAAMQATQQALQDMQQASQTAMQANQQAMQNMQDANQYHGPQIAMTQAPQFSMFSGTAAAGTAVRIKQAPHFRQIGPSQKQVNVAAGTMIRIKSPTHYATIYYTTNGWSPTTASKKYTGPIRISHDTVLQAIAVAPNLAHSLITRAEYKVPGGSQAALTVLNTDGVLHSGTKLRLATTAQIDSKTAQVGDTFLLRLEQDITAGGKVVIPKGTTVEALITQADPAGHVGVAGDIAFSVQPLVLNGISIPLTGGETLEGENHMQRAAGMTLIPIFGAAALLQHGEQAVIKPGMPLNAVVAADTPLTPTAER